MQVIEKLATSLKGMSRLEQFVTVVGSIEPIAALPQLTKLYTTKSGEDLAPESWWFGVFSDGLWFYWGIKSKNIPIVVTGFLWTIFDVAILWGAYAYS